MNKKFLRQCIVCKKYKEKEELIRLTRDFSDREVKINADSSIYGRSVYICKDKNCVEHAVKKKMIKHYIKSDISENVKEILSTVLQN